MDLQGDMYQQLIVRCIIIIHYNHNFNDSFLIAGFPNVSIWAHGVKQQGRLLGGFMHVCVGGSWEMVE